MSLQSRLGDVITAIGADYKRGHDVVSTTSTSTLTPDATSYQFNLTAQAAALLIDEPTGTPIDGQAMMFRVKDNGTARAITWDSVYRAVGVTLPTTTVMSKVLYVGAKWNAAESVWDVLAVGQEA